MQKEDLNDLLNRYRSGAVTEEERAFLENWYLHFRDTDNKPEYSASHRAEDADSIWLSLQEDYEDELEYENVQEHNSEDEQAGKEENDEQAGLSLWQRITAAAAILIAVSFGLYFYLAYKVNPHAEFAAHTIKQEIVPGGNNATLTLADGRKISLNDVKNGELARQSGIVVTKAADGQLVYTVLRTPKQSKYLQYNTISTPNGGQYQVQLPDGTRVWLNSGSSLKYPALFSAKQRKVELNGEAYFEVARDKSKPFLVTTSRQTVQVLGTHFNISAYSDEASVKTTLLEGSVKVSAAKGQKIIKPGQQAILSEDLLEVQMADIEETMAWKNGYFRFNNEKIDDVLRKLSRWYDVQFQYEAMPSDEAFNGVISRSKNIGQVLKMLEKTKVIHFKTEGRRIIVMP